MVHFHNEDFEVREKELSFVLEEMDPYRDDCAIILGDMNFPYLFRRFADYIFPLPYKYVRQLREVGWYHCAGLYIDQIWTSPSLEPYAESGGTIRSKVAHDSSDHLPEVAKIRVPPR